MLSRGKMTKTFLLLTTNFIIILTIIALSGSSLGVTQYTTNQKAPEMAFTRNTTSNISIQEMIDNADPGDTIHLPSGEFYGNLEIQKPINIIGNGMRETTINSEYHGTLIDIRSDNVTIKDLCLVGGYDVFSEDEMIRKTGFLIEGNNIEIADCFITAFGGFAFDIDDCSGSIIQNNFIYNVEIGLDAWNLNHSVIRNNTFFNNYYQTFNFARYCHDNLIIRNQFDISDQQVFDSFDNGTNNRWNDSKTGNHFTPFLNPGYPDNNNDGIVDKPYNISGKADAVDHRPVKRPRSMFWVINDCSAPPKAEVGVPYKFQIIRFNDTFPLVYLSYQYGMNNWGYEGGLRVEDEFINGTPIPEEVGIHQINITIDGTYLHFYEEYFIEVIDTNYPPEISYIHLSSNHTYFEGDTLVVKGHAEDPDLPNDELTYTWKADDEPIGTGENISVSFEKDGEHELILNVTDSKGLGDEASYKITIFENISIQEPAKPAIDPTPNQVLVIVGGISALALGIVFLLLTEVGLWALLAYVLIPIYSKINPKKVLSNNTRESILNFIYDNPGSHFNQIGEELDISKGTVAHHTRVLKDRELIKIETAGLYKRFFPINHNGTAFEKLTPNQKKIVDALKENGPCTQASLANCTELSQPTISRQLGELIMMDIVTKSGKKRKAVFGLNDTDGKKK